jgi:hypothetical protein
MTESLLLVSVFFIFFGTTNMFYIEWNVCWWYMKVSHVHLSAVYVFAA